MTTGVGRTSNAAGLLSETYEAFYRLCGMLAVHLAQVTGQSIAYPTIFWKAVVQVEQVDWC